MYTTHTTHIDHTHTVTACVLLLVSLLVPAQRPSVILRCYGVQVVPGTPEKAARASLAIVLQRILGRENLVAQHVSGNGESPAGLRVIEGKCETTGTPLVTKPLFVFEPAMVKLLGIYRQLQGLCVKTPPKMLARRTHGGVTVSPLLCTAQAANASSSGVPTN
jgi:hypothetical protein